ncbi:MAG: hypothetical protein ACD_21C00132G0016 [uncultured bacterium]|nr:MAG: hypothetical protein ACD_21C00132G0016 [uncultured bacterium]
MKASRFIHLIKRDILVRQSPLIAFALTVAAILFLFNLIAPLNIISINDNPLVYYFILFFGGLWMTGSAFKDVHDKKQAYFLLTLPCSNGEKFFSCWLITSIGYALSALVLYTVVYWLIAFVNVLVFRTPLILFKPIQPIVGRAILQYLVIQSIFFLGAIYFKKNQLLKTILTLVSISIVMAIFSALFSVAVFSPLFFVQTWVIHDVSSVDFASLAGWFKLLFWTLLAPFCLWVAYQRLTEYEDK